MVSEFDTDKMMRDLSSCILLWGGEEDFEILGLFLKKTKGRIQATTEDFQPGLNSGHGRWGQRPPHSRIRIR